MPKHTKDVFPLFIRMTKDERDRLRAAQEARGFHSLSEFVRFVLKTEAERVLKRDKVA